MARVPGLLVLADHVRVDPGRVDRDDLAAIVRPAIALDRIAPVVIDRRAANRAAVLREPRERRAAVAVDRVVAASRVAVVVVVAVVAVDTARHAAASAAQPHQHHASSFPAPPIGVRALA